jgi:glycosyltransferase involved in cell wall biosynthesis
MRSASDIRILLVTEDSVSNAHGTGTCLLRLFADLDRAQLFNLYWMSTGEPLLPGAAITVDSAVHEAAHARLARAVRRIGRAARRIGRVTGRAGAVPAWANAPASTTFTMRESPRAILDGHSFRPDVIYAVLYGPKGIALLERLIAEYGPAVPPVIVHFLDWVTVQFPGGDAAPALRRIAPAVSAWWVLTPPMREALQPALAAPVHVVNAFGDSPPGYSKTVHRPFTPQVSASHPDAFQAVIVGSIWMGYLIPQVAQMWARLQAALPGLAPIRWYCHPNARRNTFQAFGLDPEMPMPSMIDAGFIHDRAALYAMLAQCDMALIPFNQYDAPENHYARYSFPSRFTETAFAGLPVFVMGGRRTCTGEFVLREGVGAVCSFEDERALASALETFILDREARAMMGARACAGRARVQHRRTPRAPAGRRTLAVLVLKSARARIPSPDH